MELEDGTKIEANFVVSSLDPHQTFLGRMAVLCLTIDKFIITYPCYKLNETTGEVEPIPGAAELNYKQIAQISEKDAETNEKIRVKFEKYWKDAIMKQLLSPLTPGKKTPMEELAEEKDPEKRLDPRYRFMTVAEIAWDLYESPEMRNYWIRSTMSFCGVLPNMTIGHAALAMAVAQ